MKKLLLAAVCGAVFSGAATADHHHGVPKIDASWNTFVRACEDPGSVNRQKKTDEIDIICKRTFYRWIPETHVIDIDNSGKLCYEVKSSKIDVKRGSIDLDEFDPDAAQSHITCANARKIKETVKVKRRVTCDDIEDFIHGAGDHGQDQNQDQCQDQGQDQGQKQGDCGQQKPTQQDKGDCKLPTLAEYCAEIIKEERQQNPRIVRIKKTDDRIVLCRKTVKDMADKVHQHVKEKERKLRRFFRNHR